MGDHDVGRPWWRSVRWWVPVLASAVAAVAVVVALSASSGRHSLPLPEQDEVAATFLEDGTPVFVVVDEYGLRVLDAISPHTTSGKLVYWCISSRTFHDPFHGSLLDARGDYLGGPAPRGLVTYAATVEDGRVYVGDVRDPVERFARPTLPVEGDLCGDEPGGPIASDVVAHGIGDVLDALGGADSQPTLDHPVYGQLDILPVPIAPAG